MVDQSQQVTQPNPTDTASLSNNQGDIPVEIQVFLEELIEEANIPAFDEGTKQQVVKDLFERLDKFIALKISENLSEEDTEAFIKMNEEGKPKEEIDAYISTHIPNAQEMFTKAFIDFRDFYLTAQSNFQEVA